MTIKTIGAFDYTLGRLSTFKQLHVARKMAPVLGIITSMKMSGAGVNFESFLGPIAQILAGMSDADVEGIIGDCLAVCRRKLPGDTGYVPIWNTSTNSLQMEDLNLADMMQLTYAVLQENIGSFLPVSLGTSNAPPQAPPG